MTNKKPGEPPKIGTLAVKNADKTKSLSVINDKKYPGAAAVNKKLTEAKENGTYFSREKQKKHPGHVKSTTFKVGEPKPKKLTLTEELAERLGIDRINNIFNKMVSCAEEGEMQALLFFMVRLFPQGKIPRKVLASIRDLVTLADVDQAAIQMADLMGKGEVDIDDGKLMLESYKIAGLINFGQTQQQLEDLTKKLKDRFGDDFMSETWKDNDSDSDSDY